MSEKKEKTDWSRTANARSASSVGIPNHEEPPQHIPVGKLVPSNNSPKVPNSLVVGASGIEEPQGIIAKWRANQISRKATLSALESAYNAQLEVIKARLSKAVEVEKVRVNVLAEEYLNKLDAEHLKVLSELDIKNHATRMNVIQELNNSTAQKLKEVQDADWPQEMVDETINNLFVLRKRVINKIMKEVGDNQS